jgi:hypothetical protein
VFFLSKLLAFMPFGNFLRGPFGKFIIGGAIVAAMVLGYIIWLAAHDASIRKTALLEFNQAQIEQTLKDQQEFEKRMAELLAGQDILLGDVIKERDSLRQQTKKLIDRIKSGEFAGGDSSEVLREAIRGLEQRRRNLESTR